MLRVAGACMCKANSSPTLMTPVNRPPHRAMTQAARTQTHQLTALCLAHNQGEFHPHHKTLTQPTWEQLHGAGLWALSVWPRPSLSFHPKCKVPLGEDCFEGKIYGSYGNGDYTSRNLTNTYIYKHTYIYIYKYNT